jgi:hypothetical protein
MKRQDLSGKQFGSLTAVRDVGVRSGRRLWLCKCSCGGESLAVVSDLTRTDGKATKSCMSCRNRKKWEPVYEGKICKIPLTSGGFALIDAEDYDKIKHLSWRTTSTCGYVGNYVFRGQTNWLAKMVMGATKEQEVDHINHDRLDNRKENLRICTSSQNCMNRSAKISNTGVKGVCFVKATGKYQVMIMASGVSHYLGQFSTLEEAIAVRKKAEEQYHKEFRYKP